MESNSTSKSAGIALAVISVFTFAFANVGQAKAFKAEAPSYGNALFNHFQFQLDDNFRMKAIEFRADRGWNRACCMTTIPDGPKTWSVFGPIAFSHNFDTNHVARAFQGDTLRGVDTFAVRDFRNSFHTDLSAFSIAHFDRGSYPMRDKALISLHDSNFNSFATAAFHLDAA